MILSKGPAFSQTFLILVKWNKGEHKDLYVLDCKKKKEKISTLETSHYKHLFHLPILLKKFPTKHYREN